MFMEKLSRENDAWAFYFNSYKIYEKKILWLCIFKKFFLVYWILDNSIEIDK